jgi:hypothetical protein
MPEGSVPGVDHSRLRVTVLLERDFAALPNNNLAKPHTLLHPVQCRT